MTVYPITATGDATPIATLAGSATKLNQPFFPAVNSTGRLYVSNENQGRDTGSVTEYLPPLGNVAPAGVISGFYQPAGVSVDSSDNLYVAMVSAIDIFGPPGSGSGEIRAIGGSNTHLTGNSPYQVFVEASGKIDVAVQNEVDTFAPGANGNVAPMQAIVGTNTTFVAVLGVAADSSGNLYVTDSASNDILEFGPTANGNTTPSAVIAGAAFNQPWGIFTDAMNNTYVANRGNNSVLVFTSSALALGMPTATISGPHTGLDNPTGVYVR